MLNDLDYIILAIFLVSGFVWLYNAYRLKKEPKLFESKVLYPGNCSPKDCRDPEGFRAFMLPKCVLMGVMFLLVAGFYGLKLAIEIPMYVVIPLLIAAVAFFGWCFWCYNKASRLFW